MKTLWKTFVLGGLALTMSFGAENSGQGGADEPAARLRDGFKDPDFKAAVIKALGAKKCAPTNELVQADPVETIGSLNLGYFYTHDLSGIEQLSGLTNLDCHHQDLGSFNLNLSMCTNLVRLDCQESGLRNLNLVGAVSLKHLYCQNNPALKDLRLPSSLTFEGLTCYDSGLSDLDVSRYPRLQWLLCNGGNLTNLIDCRISKATVRAKRGATRIA